MATIEGDSQYAVAYRLMEKIASSEKSDATPERASDPRKYYLTLFGKCLAATTGNG